MRYSFSSAYLFLMWSWKHSVEKGTDKALLQIFCLILFYVLKYDIAFLYFIDLILSLISLKYSSVRVIDIYKQPKFYTKQTTICHVGINNLSCIIINTRLMRKELTENNGVLSDINKGGRFSQEQVKQVWESGDKKLRKSEDMRVMFSSPVLQCCT